MEKSIDLETYSKTAVLMIRVALTDYEMYVRELGGQLVHKFTLFIDRSCDRKRVIEVCVEAGAITEAPLVFLILTIDTSNEKITVEYKPLWSYHGTYKACAGIDTLDSVLGRVSDFLSRMQHPEAILPPPSKRADKRALVLFQDFMWSLGNLFKRRRKLAQ